MDTSLINKRIRKFNFKEENLGFCFDIECNNITTNFSDECLMDFTERLQREIIQSSRIPEEFFNQREM